MSEYIDERIVSIKFDNSGFAKGVSETQKSLEDLNKSLEFNDINDSGKKISNIFKNISTEAKSTDLSPLGNAVENVKEKFSVLETIGVGALFKIGSEVVETGKKFIKSISIDPIAKGFDKYQQILTAQMTMIASLGGETEEEIKRNKEQIEESMKILTWYADETSASLQDMLTNLSSFSKYGVDLDIATDAIMGIANAGFKAGISIPMITHALEGFSKSIGLGYVSYQTWKTWIHTSGIDTIEFKNTFVDAAKTILKEGGELGEGIRLLGDNLQYYAGKSEGWLNVTAESFENSLTKGKWLTNDVLLTGLERYNAAMRDVYELTDRGAKSVSDLTEEEKALVDQISLAAFMYGQQSKTLSEVTDSMQDAITTAWANIFKALIGDYEQTVQIWSDMAEYIYDFFVYPLQDVTKMLEEFGASTSNIRDEATGNFLTMREVIVGSIMNIFEAIKSVVDPIRKAFDAVFHPFETVPQTLQNGVEKVYSFTKSLILTEEKAQKLGAAFVTIFTILKNVWTIIKIIATTIKNLLYPVIQTVGSIALKIIVAIIKVLYKVASTISTFISELFGVRDVVADMKDQIIEAAYAFDEEVDSINENREAIANLSDEYEDNKDIMYQYTDSIDDATESVDDLTEAEEFASEAAANAANAEIDFSNQKAESVKANTNAVNDEIAAINKKEKVVTRTETKLQKLLRNIFTSFHSSLKTVPVLGKVADYFHNIFGVFNKGTQTVIEGTKEASKELEKSGDVFSNTSKNDIKNSQTNFNETKKAVDDTSKSVSNLSTTYDTSAKSIKNGSKIVTKAFNDIKNSSKDASKTFSDSLLSGLDSGFSKKGISFGDKVKNAFEDMDKTSKSGKESSIWEKFIESAKKAIDWIKEHIPSIFTSLQDIDIFGHLKTAIEKAWDKIVEYFKQKSQEAKDKGFKNILSLYAEEIKDSKIINTFTSAISVALDTIKSFLKEQLEKAGFGNIINIWDNFSYDVQKYFGRVKEAIHVVFGSGTIFEKLSSGSLWRPFLELVINTIDKFDNLSTGIDSIKQGIKNASSLLDQNFKTALDNIIEKWEKIRDFFENFSTNLEKAKADLVGGSSGGGGSDSNEKENGGIMGIIAKISLKWDAFKKKLEEGIDWDNIGKVSALEIVLERIIGAVSRAWLRIGIGQMAMDIGSLFDSFANGIDSIAKVVSKEKDIGNILLKIATAIAILAASLVLLSSIDSTALNNAVDALEKLAKILVLVAAGMGAMITLLRWTSGSKGAKQIKGGSVGEILAGGLSNLLGTKDTMTQAAKMLIGIGAGLLLLSASLALIVDATKDLSVGQITKAMVVLVLISAVLVGLLFAISKLMDSINGKGSTGINGPGIAINLKNKEINKTVSSVGETLKGFALALGVLIAGFVIITKVLENVDSTWNVVAAFAILVVMIFAVIEFVKISTDQIKKLSEVQVDPKLFESLSKVMKALALGMATMVYGFKVLTDVIMDVMNENPDALVVAIPVFFAMVAVLGLFLFGVLAACKYLLGEKTEEGDYGGLFRKKGSWSKQEKVDSSKVSDILKSVAGLITALGFGVKLMASAFKQVVETVKSGMEDPLAFAAGAAAFVLILLTMTLMVIEIAKAATKMPAGQEKVITSFAIMFAALGISVKLIADSVGDLAKDLSKADTTAMWVAVGVVGALMLIVGAIITAFAVVSAKGNGDSLMAVGKAFALIGVGLLAMATSVYALAKGIQEMVIAMSMVGSASDNMKSGLKTILDMIAEGIGFAMTALIQGFIAGLEQTLDRWLELIEHAITSIIAMMDTLLPKIEESLEKNKDHIISILTNILEIIFTVLNNALPEFAEWFDNLQEKVIYPALDKLLDWLHNRLLPSLIDILQQILDFLIGEPNGIIYQIEDAIKNFVIWIGDLGEEIVNSISRIWAAIYVFITDTLFPDIEGLWKGLLDLVDQLIDDLLTFLNNGIQNWGGQVIDIIVDLIGVIEDGHKEITEAIESLMLTVADDVVSLFETGGTVVAKLLTIPAKVVGAIIKEFKNLLHGGSLFEQVFGDMGEGDSIEAKAGNMWERVEKIFTDKDHAGINEAEEISESSKKWGIYIANGLAKGLSVIPRDLNSIIKSFWETIKKGYNNAAGLNDRGDAFSSGEAYKLGENTGRGIIEGLEDFATSRETRDAAKALWEEIDSKFRESAKIKSPSKESYKWGQYIGLGLTNGIEKSSKETGQAAIDMWKSFENPMKDEMSSFAAVTSSMLSQLLDADMDINPVITPVFDMSNLAYANDSINGMLGSRVAVNASTSFSSMQGAKAYTSTPANTSINNPNINSNDIISNPNTRTELDRLANSITDLANRQSVAPEVNITFAGTSGAIARALKQDMARENRRASAFT